MYNFHVKLFDIFPEWFVLWIYPLVTLGLMAVMSVIFRKLLVSETHYDSDSNVVDTATQNTLSAAYVIMGFTLVLVMGSVDKYESNVVTEGTQIESLDRLLILDASPEAAAMRRDLIRYTESVIQDDWPKLTSGGSDITEVLTQTLSNHLKALSPETPKQQLLFSDIVSKTDEVIHSRELRLLSASGGLPVLFWTLSYLYLFGVAVICALRLSHATPMRIIALSTQITMLSLIFSAVMIIDHPFQGETNITSEPIKQALDSLKKSQP